MHRLSLIAVLTVLVVSLGLAADPLTTSLPTPKAADPRAADLKPLDEVWEAAYVQNAAGVDVKIGHIHMTSVPVTVGGEKLIRTTKELRLTVGRAGAEVLLKADTSTDEDAGRKVQAINARIWLGTDKVQPINCKINGEKISVDLGAGQVAQYRWDPNNLGLAGEQTLLRDKKAKAGDEFTYRYYCLLYTSDAADE